MVDGRFVDVGLCVGGTSLVNRDDKSIVQTSE